MKKTKRETFRQLFIKISKHVTKRKYDCYSSEFNTGFYDIVYREIENNLPVKLDLYDICCNIMKGKYKRNYINHLSIEHYSSDEFYFNFRMDLILGNKLICYGISKKNSYFICKYIFYYFKNVFFKK